MNKAYTKYFILFSFFLYSLVTTSYAQDGCYNCNTDSLAALLKMAKTDDEKIRLLEILAPLYLPFLTTTSDTNARVSFQSLVELGKSNKIENIDAYKTLLEGLHFYEEKHFMDAQNAFKNAIALFDRTHTKMTNLLTILRLTHNEVGNQEDRYTYYSEKLHYYLVNGPLINVAPCYHSLGGYYLYKGDFNLAISNYLRAIEIYKDVNARNYYNITSVVGNTYSAWGNYEKALEYLNKANHLAKLSKDSLVLTFINIDLSALYRNLKNYPKALLFSDTALAVDPKSLPAYTAEAYLEKTAALISLNQLKQAFENLSNAKKITDSFHLKVFAAYGSVETDFGYYKYYAALGENDKSIAFLLTAYKNAVDVKAKRLQLKYLKELSLFYGQHNQSGLAFNYTKKYYDLTDELDREGKAFKVAQYENEEREIRQNDSLSVLRQRGAVQAAIIKKNDLLLWGSLAAIILISTSMFFVYRQYRLNKKTLLSLRKTQRQLIVAEKMASLGEITAGIAHEIQNPLNFVTNFSEVNRELIGEMKGELVADNKHEAITIANHIDENEQKINHHGRRADAIVKGMLQHSREGKGQKEPTDLNALADEYLRLSYQGLRAKDPQDSAKKAFNATMKTDFDAAIGKINIVPQEIGRVLLNLYNNAFYAVSAKSRATADSDYNPTVKVTTRKQGDKVLISVKDNGAGISQKILDKIFQPFFTTKPTGLGTGLGLSLSYDIIKAHGGEINVESREGEGAEFIIRLPVA